MEDARCEHEYFSLSIGQDIETLNILYSKQAADIEKFLSNPDAPPEKQAPAEFGTYPGSDSIAVLTDDTFNERAKNANKMLVMFYATCEYINSFVFSFKCN